MLSGRIPLVVVLIFNPIFLGSCLVFSGCFSMTEVTLFDFLILLGAMDVLLLYIFVVIGIFYLDRRVLRRNEMFAFLWQYVFYPIMKRIKYACDIYKNRTIHANGVFEYRLYDNTYRIHTSRRSNPLLFFQIYDENQNRVTDLFLSYYGPNYNFHGDKIHMTHLGVNSLSFVNKVTGDVYSLTNPRMALMDFLNDTVFKKDDYNSF